MANTDKTDRGRKTSNSQRQQADAQALKREHAAAPQEIPVKQNNPDEQGLNPQQKGPAQPSGN